MSHWNSYRGGGKARNINTDAKGYYVFDQLPPGVYVLRLGQSSSGPAKVENHNSSRSNRDHSVRLGDGTEVHTVDIEVSQKSLPGRDPGTIIIIEKPGPGRIGGHVVTVGIKEEGVK